MFGVRFHTFAAKKIDRPQATKYAVGSPDSPFTTRNVIGHERSLHIFEAKG